MGIAGTLLIYAVIGLAVGLLLALRERRPALLLLGVAFWPLLAPFVLASPGKSASPPTPGAPPDGRIDRVQEEVLEALSGLDGLAEAALQPEVKRVRDLADAMARMDRRIADMDALLLSPQLQRRSAELQLAELQSRGVPEDDARVQSVRARLRNVDRLRALRDQSRADLERILLKLEEMASQLHVLKFAGRPEGELLSVIKEIADGVESIADGLLASDDAAAAATMQ